MNTLQNPLASKKPVQAAIPPAYIKHPHRFQIALTEGDALVLATDTHDENDNVRAKLYPVSLFYFDSINHDTGKWLMDSSGGKSFHGSAEPVALHDFVRITLTQPMIVVKKPKGYCTMFTVEIAHGYRIHFLDFVKNRLPAIYQQLLLG
jgi:hypothetical protein